MVALLIDLTQVSLTDRRGALPDLSLTNRAALYWEFARPFTLVAPALGMLSGGVTAFGAHPHVPVSWLHVVKILSGSRMAGVLEGGSVIVP